MTSTPLIGTTFFGLDLTALLLRMQGLKRQVSKRVLLLEFDSSRLNLAEVRFSGAGLQFDHVTSVELPQEALERGVPTDPGKMAGLIQEVCREKQINVHRAAVALPTEVAFQRLIELPARLSFEEARAFVVDPSSALQVPIALSQSDFDLQPTSLPVVHRQDGTFTPYLLSAVPRHLVDKIMDTLQLSEFELQALEIGGYSQLRLMAAELLMMRESEVRLVLELLPECTHFTLITASGPLRFERLAAIREFTEPSFSDEQADSFVGDGISAEQIMIRQDGYMALSELDLRVLVFEIREALKRFSEEWSGFHLCDIAITGVNSAHPILSQLLETEFGLRVVVLEPSLAHGVEGLQLDSFLVQKGLNRLVGLGLGLLPPDHLLSCPIVKLEEDSSAAGQSSALEDFRSDLPPRPQQVLPFATPVGNISDDLAPLVIKGDSVRDYDVSSVKDLEQPTVYSLLDTIQADESDPLHQEEERPSVTTLPSTEGLEEDQWPSIAHIDGNLFPVEQLDEEANVINPEGTTDRSVATESLPEEDWPSIGRLQLANTDEPMPQCEPSDEMALKDSDSEQNEVRLESPANPLGELRFSDES
ncbi:type IV pilus biogenesis protein PilM [Synechococcus sp. BS55D]|uniref:type IV pilus biogenesis protein PilM n=1 Tax=Synechococcus sp. BS55D TaxID=2055943 RepID=UPI00103A3837|nr:pilus assembly protein PilM [Synechococcus sp. BS55D]TCD57862.1 hypothetical protein CWE16_00570 [Synechococcus sp. BS55D]